MRKHKAITFPTGTKTGRQLFPLTLGLFLILVLSIGGISQPGLAQQTGDILPPETVEKIDSVKDSDYVYLFCNPLDDLRVKHLMEGAKATAEQFNLSVKFFGPKEPYDAKSVHAILQRLTARSPKGIAMEVGHPSKFDDAIGNAVERGIYVISFSVDDWTKNPRQGYVGYHWREEGMKLADELLGNMPPLSKVLILDSKTKQGRSCHARIKGITKRANDFNIDYDIVTIGPNKREVKQVIHQHMKELQGDELDAIISLWGEITAPLAQVMEDYEILHSIQTGGFGCGDFEKFVRSGHLDVLMKVVTELEGGIPLLNLYYSSLHGVTPSTIRLHAKPVAAQE